MQNLQMLLIPKDKENIESFNCEYSSEMDMVGRGL